MRALLYAALTVIVLLESTNANGLLESDVTRASNSVPGVKYRGDGHKEMASTLNQHIITSYPGFVHKPCDQWTTEELQTLQETLYGLRHPSLDQIYQEKQDNRRLRYTSLAALQAAWAKEAAEAANDPALVAVRRNGHCHEAVMWLVHHVPQTPESREALAMAVTEVPMLPEERSADAAPCQGEGASSNSAAVYQAAEHRDTCAWCHNEQKYPQQIPNALDPKYFGPDDGDPECMAKHKADGLSWTCSPHQWDRKRRCDQDYHPRCSLCEGVGGIAWNDKNEDIHIVPCTPIANASDVDPKTVKRPFQPPNFTVSYPGYYEVLIGRKRDPFCFEFFPMNNASGTLCYRAEEADWTYDISKEASVFNYHKVKMPVAPFSLLGNITSKVSHVGDRMWIVNRLYGGVEQCVCANPGKTMHDNNFPARTDWAQHAQYMGREKLHVEYLWKDMELDHFNIWAHHIWTDPATGHIVRMWKPFNGLQVIDPTAWTVPMPAANASNLEVPPALCKKGGAIARINCDDNGYYNKNDTVGMEPDGQFAQALKRLQEEHARTAAGVH